MSKKLTKAESARINGAKSKGPKTEQGKQRSRFNALRHGLAARTVCLTQQERPIFEAMVEDYNQRFKPADSGQALACDGDGGAQREVYSFQQARHQDRRHEFGAQVDSFQLRP